MEKIDDTHFVVSVREPPVRGLANKAITVALAKHFGRPIASVRLVSGATSRHKVFEI